MIYLDVRTQEEYVLEHIPGAINHDIMKLFEGNFPDLPKDSAITVYCQSGSRSSMAKSILAQNGFTTVTDGGGIRNLLKK